MSVRASLVLAGIAVAALPGVADAGGCVGQRCYREAVQPATYRTVYDTVMVRPAKVVAERTPARFESYAETVVVRPARSIAVKVPARVETVAETVLVAPPRKGWTWKVDAYGNRVWCEVSMPAQYRTVHRQVVTQPASVVHETIPAETRTVQRTRMVTPPGVVHHTVPAEYATVARSEMVTPPRAVLVPLSSYCGGWGC